MESEKPNRTAERTFLGVGIGTLNSEKETKLTSPSLEESLLPPSPRRFKLLLTPDF
jgi:hypothetical protein